MEVTRLRLCPLNVQASVEETGEIVAIKKVLQDKRFKVRVLRICRPTLLLATD